MGVEGPKWDGVERRARRGDRNALDPEQAPEIRRGIKGRLHEFLEGSESGMRISRDAARMPGMLTHGFAARLKAVRSPEAPGGLLLTFHKARVQGGRDAEVDIYVLDEAGVAYAPLQGPFERARRPLPDGEIDHAEIRRTPQPLGEALDAMNARYERKRDAEPPELGFGDPEVGIVRTAVMATARLSKEDGRWTSVEMLPSHEIAIPQNAQILHYGSGVFEGMTAEWGEDGNCYVYGIREHWERMSRGARAVGIEPIPFEVFEETILKIVQQNARFIPPNGRLYLRPHEADLGEQMRVGNSGSTTFMVEVTPIGSVESYFGAIERDEEGHVKAKGMIIPTRQVRAPEGGGWFKGVGAYAPTAEVIRVAKSFNVGTEESPHHPAGVLYLDRTTEGLGAKEVDEAMVKETNASFFFFVEDMGEDATVEGGRKYRLVMPSLEHGDILRSNTRALIVEKAEAMGWAVVNRDVPFKEVREGKFVAAGHCGTAAVISNADWVQFGSIGPAEPERADSPWKGGLVGERIWIRSQDAVDENPVPVPLQTLIRVVSEVKSARSGAEDRARYLKQVPGVRRNAA